MPSQCFAPFHSIRATPAVLLCNSPASEPMLVIFNFGNTMASEFKETANVWWFD
jgi:hypothetical protein